MAYPNECMTWYRSDDAPAYVSWVNPSDTSYLETDVVHTHPANTAAQDYTFIAYYKNW